MKIRVRATYTVNNGPEKGQDFDLKIDPALLETETGHYTIKSMVVDQLVDQGQIMLASAEVIEPADV
jgi:hypothetical protein